VTYTKEVLAVSNILMTVAGVIVALVVAASIVDGYIGLIATLASDVFRRSKLRGRFWRRPTSSMGG
jgi:hypothetical protein